MSQQSTPDPGQRGAVPAWRTCETCDHFCPVTASRERGECRRVAPRSDVGSYKFGGQWAYVHTADWCGEWVQRISERKSAPRNVRAS